MVKHVLVFMGVTLMSLLTVGLCRAQDSSSVLVLSQRVGATISAHARDEFHLFPQFHNFVDASVFQASGGNCYVRIKQKTAAGDTSETVVQFTSESLLMMAEKINHYEALKSGRYEFGEEPTYILTTDGQTALRSPAVLKNPSVLEKRILAHAWKWEEDRSQGDTISLGLSSGQSPRGIIKSVVDDSTIVFESGGKTMMIPVDSVGFLLRRAGSYFWEGAGIGTFVGFAAGAGIGASSYSPPTPGQIVDFGPGLPAIGGAIIGIPIGFAVGGLVGAAIERDDVIEFARAGHEVRLIVLRMLVYGE